jgi:hypothetical protein
MENLRLGGLGMKHINCKDCGTLLTDDTWYPSRKEQNIQVCIKCWKTNPKHTQRNSNRMFVNGKHISTKHPLHKPGNYKTFEDAAFSSLAKYESTKEGQVYIITNKAWKGWVKIGMAVDAEDRCNGYQTSSPFRDYELRYKKYFTDRRSAELNAHELCEEKAKERSGEWFKMPIKTAIKIIENINEEQHEKETA